MQVTLRDEAENIDETLGTLRFAQRAKAVKLTVRRNTFAVKDPSKLLSEYEATQAELGSTRLLVKQLELQLASRAAEEGEELRRRQAEAGGAAPGRKSAQDVLQAGVAELEVAGLRRQNKVLRLQAQP